MRNSMRTLVLTIAMSALASTAFAQEHTATAAEEAVIVHYRTALAAVIDGMAPGAGWTENQPNHMDIPDNPSVVLGKDVPFYFDGTISRMYESASTAEDPSVKMTALTQELYSPATSSARRKEIVAEIQKLAQAPQQQASGPRQLLITTADNMGYVAPDGDQATLTDIKLPGVARVYKEPAHQIHAEACYVLEFGDPTRYARKDDAIWYSYAHTDGTAHIETAEITLQGPQDVLDHILQTTDWTKVDAALNP